MGWAGWQHKGPKLPVYESSWRCAPFRVSVLSIKGLKEVVCQFTEVPAATQSMHMCSKPFLDHACSCEF